MHTSRSNGVAADPSSVAVLRRPVSLETNREINW
jgi:hypothetical protein